MPAVDVTAVNAHNAAITACTAAMYRPLRKVTNNVGAFDPLIVAANTAIATAMAATNAATSNPSNNAAVAYQYNRFLRLQSHTLPPIGYLGVRRRRAFRLMRFASQKLVVLHGANTP